MELDKLQTIVVGVDPSGGKDPENDEQGIIVGGLGYDDHGYVLDDVSCRLSPDAWGRRAITAYLDHMADFILYEDNYGGEMVDWTIQSVAQDMGVTVKTKKVHASRGKRLRAEPVAALYEQGRVHHVGVFSELEQQMTEWSADMTDASPDRLDALVFVITELMVDPMPVVTSSSYSDVRLRRRR